MTADATAQLIQRITGQLPQRTVNSYGNSTNFMGAVDSVVGIAANYAQILSLVVNVGGADAAAAAAAAAALEQGATAASVATAAAGAAASAGIGAVVVIFISFVMGIIGELTGDTGSTDFDAIFQDFVTRLADLQNTDTVSYFQEKLQGARHYWTNLYRDLNNLQLEGVTGPQVQGPPNHAGDFITDAQNMVIDLLDAGSGYWQRPFLQELQFSVQNVPYPAPGYPLIPTPGWYGQLPRPQLQSSSDAPGAIFVSDPNTIMPMAVWAAQAYLTIWEVAHEIDPVQYTFPKFLQTFWPDLRDYAQFLYLQHTLAIGAQPGNGIDSPPYGLIKTDMPSFADMVSFMLYNETALSPWLPNWAGSPFAYTDNDHAPTAGYSWNGVYGVADQFGPYPTEVAVPSTGPSCIVELFSTDTLYELFTVIPSDVDPASWLQYYVQYSWTYPWLATRLTLALMARWKALYLFHGHSATWSIIQNFQALASAGAASAGQPPLPALAVPTLPDGTLAIGHWSVRELFSVIEKGGPAAHYGATELFSTDGKGYSVFQLVRVFDILAKGDWSGYQQNSSISLPASFRDRLAAAALV